MMMRMMTIMISLPPRCTVSTVSDTAHAEVPLRVIVNAPVITRHSPDIR